MEPQPVSAPAQELSKLKPAVKSFACPSCGGVVALRASGHSLTAVCSHCSSVIDVADKNYRIIKQVKEKERATLLPIGARGVLFSNPWEVIGYTRKSDSTGEYVWDEYLLFNPYRGFRFLVESQGHWSFVTMIKKVGPPPGALNYWNGGDNYKIFLRDASVVQYVKGEFYWRVKKGEKTAEADYIAPPYFLAVEGTDGDVVVSQGLYTEPEVVRDAFEIKEKMPKKVGVAMNQPSPYRGAWKVGIVFVFALILAFFIQGRASAKADKEPLLSVNETYTVAQRNQTLSSPVFNIRKESNVLINTYAQVDNNWVEVNYSLVSEDSQHIYEMVAPVEYYHGYDSDGAWSEGGLNNSKYIAPSVPLGNYRLLYEVDAGIFPSMGSVNVSFNVIRDVPSDGNFWWTFILLAAFPAYAWMRNGSFEAKRWSQSDFNPYDKGDD